MSKTYQIWWHSRFVDEINREAITIEDIIDKAGKTIKNLEKLKALEKQGKLKVRVSGTLNPFLIDVLDDSIIPEVENNPLVENK